MCPSCKWASQRPIRPALISGFCSMKQPGVFLLPLDGILVHHQLPPSIFSGCPQSNLVVVIYSRALSNCFFLQEEKKEASFEKLLKVANSEREVKILRPRPRKEALTRVD